MIPDKVRSERLFSSAQPISNAQLSLSDPNMKTLVDVWTAFIEPNKQVTNCPICLDTIRKNFLQMLETLVELEEQYQLLKEI